MANPNDLSLAGLKNMLDDALLNKIDKDENRGLSENDFTTELKNKLEELIQSNMDTPPVPVTNKPGLVLNSTAVEGVYKWNAIAVYDHSKMTNIDKQLHLTDADRVKINNMITKSYLESEYYTKGETEQRIYQVINSYTNANSIIAVIQEVNKMLSDTQYTNGLSLAEYMVTELNNKVDKENGKGLSTRDFTQEYQLKLDSLSNYVLPKATEDILGGVMAGYGLKTDEVGRMYIDADTVVTKELLDSIHSYVLPPASTDTLGGIKIAVGEGLSIDTDGTLHVPQITGVLDQIDAVNVTMANKLDKECILCGTADFSGGATTSSGIKSTRLVNPTNRKVNVCNITRMDNTAGLGDIWYEIESGTNDVLVFNTGVPRGRFSYLIILKDEIKE